MILALGGGLATAGDVGTSKSYHGPTGLQLYSLRDMQKTDGVEAALDKAAALGFKFVEVSDLAKFSPAEFKAQLDRRGLVPIGRHFPFDQLRADIESVARDAKALGLPYVGCAWIPHKDPFTPEQCHEAARVFNYAAAALAKHGIKFYYHDHGYEFQPYQHGTLFDLLAAETDPKAVFFEMDVFWTVLPGQDPVRLLEKYPERWLFLHLKDLKKGVPTGSLTGQSAKTNDVALGDGQVQWPALFRTARKVGVKYYFIEDESPAVLQQLPRSLRYLESLEW
jgi:sugar phosphate isomerase/epimerase